MRFVDVNNIFRAEGCPSVFNAIVDFLVHLAGDWQSDSLALKTRQFLHRLLKDQMKTALVLLHKEILDFAAR